MGYARVEANPPSPTCEGGAGVVFLQSSTGPGWNVELLPRLGESRRLIALKLSTGSSSGECDLSIAVGEEGGEKRNRWTGDAMVRC